MAQLHPTFAPTHASLATTAAPSPARDLALLHALFAARSPAARRGALTALVRRLQPLVARCVARALRRARRDGDCDPRDLVNDVWLALLRDDLRVLRRFDPGRGCTLDAFVARVACRTAVDVLRARPPARWQPLDGAIEELLHARAGPTVDPLEQRQELERARAAFARLAPSERRFLARALFDERHRPRHEADACGVTVHAVYKRKLALRRKLQAMLREPRTLLEATL